MYNNNPELATKIKIIFIIVKLIEKSKILKSKIFWSKEIFFFK